MWWIPVGEILLVGAAIASMITVACIVFAQSMGWISFEPKKEDPKTKWRKI